MNIPGQKNTFNYLGSKYSVLPALLPLLPVEGIDHTVDACGGSAVVLLNRPATPIETYNDKNEQVFNFFSVLRQRPDDLIRALTLTPYSREEYQRAWDQEGLDEVERARRFFVRVRQSFLATGSQQETKGWNASVASTRCKISEAVNKWLRSVEGLYAFVDRLRQIQLENRSYHYLLQAYDTPRTLFYMDPPYDNEKRNASTYMHEFSADDHRELRNLAVNVQGRVAISCYDTGFYLEELYGELIAEGRFYLTRLSKRKNNLSEKAVMECLLTNYDPHQMNRHRLF